MNTHRTKVAANADKTRMEKVYVWSVVMALLWTGAAAAEDEVLFLPDNPNSAPVKTNTNAKTKDDDGDEVLFLPDNPGAQTPKDTNKEKKPAEKKEQQRRRIACGFF